jgi:integrase
MTSSGIAQMLRRRGVEVEIVGLHPHQLRHSFANYRASCWRGRFYASPRADSSPVAMRPTY